MPDTLPRSAAPLFRLLSERTRRLCLPNQDSSADRSTIANLALHFVGGSLTRDQRDALLALYRHSLAACPPEVYALRVLALIAEATPTSDKLTVRLSLDASACLTGLQEAVAELDRVLAKDQPTGSHAQ